MPGGTKRRVDWRRVYRANFVPKVLNRKHWFKKANQLVSAAEILVPHVKRWWKSLEESRKGQRKAPHEHAHHEIMLMLYGYAIENLCKGVIVGSISAKDRRRLREEGRLPKQLKTHNLLRLVKSTGLEVDLEDEDILRRMERSTLWEGRYPVPGLSDGVGPQKFSNGKRYSMSWLGLGDIERSRRLIERLREQVGAPKTYYII